MKSKYVYTMLSIEVLVLILGLIFSWESLTKNLNDLFIGALGLLTFISIFYSLTISGGIKRSQEVKNLLKSKQNKAIEKVLKEILKEKDKMSKLDKLEKVKLEADKIATFLDYLNFNK